MHSRARALGAHIEEMEASNVQQVASLLMMSILENGMKILLVGLN
jgi:hypothetical protein